MTNSQIIRRAVDQAVANGWDRGWTDWWHDKIFRYGHYEVIFFSHDFARAFWGEDRWEHRKTKSKARKQCRVNPNITFDVPEHYVRRRYKVLGWEYHIQKLALLSRDERFKYLEKFLKK